jgi:hypothetical protein
MKFLRARGSYEGEGWECGYSSNDTGSWPSKNLGERGDTADLNIGKRVEEGDLVVMIVESEV